MSDLVSVSQSQLRLEHVFDAPREAVFDAWTNPDVLARWWAAGPEMEPGAVEVDLRVGGRYRLAMRDPASGAEPTVAGEYIEVRRPERLEYTWSWEAPAPGDSQDTRVTVEFLEDGDRTLVILTQSGFASEASRERHGHGWQGCFASLADRVFAAAPNDSQPRGDRMPDYTAMPLADCEQIFGGMFLRARAGLGVTSFGMQVLQLPPDADFYPNHDHNHDDQEEVYVVLSGSADFDIEGERVSATPDTAIRVAPGTKRQIHPGPEGVRLLALGAVPGGAYKAPEWTELGGPDPTPPSQ